MIIMVISVILFFAFTKMMIKWYGCFPIQVDFKNMALNQDYSFQIVKNESINKEKYNQIVNLKTKFYPSEIKSNIILNYFIEKVNI